LSKKWAPFLEKLGTDSGLCFDLYIPSDITAFEKELKSGKPDFAFMNPYLLVLPGATPGYIPLVRDQQLGLEGILVVRKDSPVRRLKDLEGATIAFPVPNAFAASLMIRARLLQEGVKFTPSYVESHSNVYRSVLRNGTQAGGGVNNTFQREPEELRASLRVLYTTPAVAVHPFASHPRIPGAIREKVTKAFLGMAEDRTLRPLLDGIQVPKPVRADYARDYLPLKKLGLEKLVVSGD